MSRIFTLQDIQNREIIDNTYHRSEIEKYKNLSVSLTKQILKSKKENLKDKNYISMLESKLKEVNEKLKKYNLNINIRTEATEEEKKEQDNIFKMVNKILLNDLEISDDEYDKIKQDNLKKLENLLK